MRQAVHTRHQQPLRAAALFAFSAIVGFVVAAIVVLNLHIMVGLEEGYAAPPGDVWSRSPILAALDVVLLAGGPALGVLAVRGVLRRERR
jgi:hypothetical protein